MLHMQLPNLVLCATYNLIYYHSWGNNVYLQPVVAGYWAAVDHQSGILQQTLGTTQTSNISGNAYIANICGSALTLLS